MGELWIWLQKFSNQEESIFWLGNIQVTGLVGNTRHAVFLWGAINPLTLHTPVYAHLNWRPSLQVGWGTAVQQHGGLVRVESRLLAWPCSHCLGLGVFKWLHWLWRHGILQKKMYLAHQSDLYRAAASCLHCWLLTNGLQNEKNPTVSWPRALGIHKTKSVIKLLRRQSRGA